MEKMNKLEYFSKYYLNSDLVILEDLPDGALIAGNGVTLSHLLNTASSYIVGVASGTVLLKFQGITIKVDLKKASK